MSKSKFLRQLILEFIPVVIIILLIPWIKNDYLLLGLYVGIIGIAFIIKYISWDWLFFCLL